jgi:D-sedoheptulose 7-phosphate isomerase
MSLNIQKKIEETVLDSIATKRKTLEQCAQNIQQAAEILIESYRNGGKILFCGNGGSAADAQHLAAELVIRLRSSVNRRALPAIALTVDPSIMTAGGNDIGFENVFARAVEAYGNVGDVLVGISTSGNSENVIRAVSEAKKHGLKVVLLLGGAGGKLAGMGDSAVIVPSFVTARVQESHIMIGHIWCEAIEEVLFPNLFEK